MDLVGDSKTASMCGPNQTVALTAERPTTATPATAKGATEFHAEVVWKNALGFLLLHILAVYSLWVIFNDLHPFTFIWAYLLANISGIGISIGAHRLFSHRSFKANSGVRAFLLFAQTVAGQNCQYIWTRDHRQHHKHSDTSADPHDSTRGFFFSHIGWLMVRKHPDVIRAGKHVDMSDLEADKLVMFQKKYYKSLYLVFAFLLPILVPCYYWGETLWNSFLVAYVYRTIIVLNFTWLVNSAAHLYGTRPFDKHIAPVENAVVAYFVFGEGWHNFHHSYPWDYRTSELGTKFNPSAKIIEWFAAWGWVTDLRSASHNVVMAKIALKGDGTHGKAAADLPPQKVALSWLPVHIGEKLLHAAWDVTRGVYFGCITSVFLLVKYYWVPWVQSRQS